MIQINFVVLSWLFAISITVHNLEEAIWLPKWSKSAGRWHHPVEPAVFRFAVLTLTILAYIFAILASVGEKQSIGAYLVAGYALAMLLNVVFPHLIATIALKKYAPGLATALFFNLPVTAGLLYHAVIDAYIDLNRFYYIGPMVTIGILGSIPVLFVIGNRVFVPRKQS
ncbi:HXXEE domain-containing protein [bacterium]|nr:HXXEE domain-containing protein [bacterium]